MKNDDKKYMPKAQKRMLSFAVTSTSQGQQVIYFINENIGEIKSFAEGSDDRNFYKHLAFKEGKDQVVICISHDNEGCYLRILRYIQGGRSGDNQEAWIYIPANLVVPADMLDQAITVVKKAILDTNLTEHKTELENFFSNEYDIRDVYPTVKKSAQGKSAYRIIPQEGIQSLFGDKLFESYYYDFEKILFVDKEYFSVVDFYEDITSNGFTKWVAITRISSASNVIIKVDGVDLNQGMMIDSQKSYDIEYIKADYLEPIKKIEKFDKDTQLPACKLDFQYELKASYFRVYDEETSEDLSEKANIKIEDYLLAESALFSESELRERKLKIAIQCSGYEDKSDTFKTNVPVYQPIVKQLKHKTSIYKFSINSKYLEGSKSDAEFKLELREKPSCSPLKSYEMSEQANNNFHLRPLSVISLNWKFWLTMFVGALLFIAVGLGLGYLWGMTQSSSAASNEESTEVVTDSLAQQSNKDSVETSKDDKKGSDSSFENKDNQKPQDTKVNN